MADTCGCNCSRNYYSNCEKCIPCGTPVHTPWCYPSCPPRMSQSSSPFCGPKCYTNPRPYCRCCQSHSVSRRTSLGTKRFPKDACIPPPMCCSSPYPYGACSCSPISSVRHGSYCAGCGSCRCSSGYGSYKQLCFT